MYKHQHVGGWVGKTAEGGELGIYGMLDVVL